MTEGKKVWVTGANGFVGSSVVKYAEDHGYTVLATPSDLSVCDFERLQAFAEEARPDVVINCAGIRKEAAGFSNRVRAYEVNALGARNVALAADGIDAIMVQISTDDVYCSKLEEPVNEFDSPHPDTPYGKSKRAGEVMVRDTTRKHIIVRSSWLYNCESGMLAGALAAAKADEKYEARMDQYAAPVSLATYLDFVFRAIEKERFGTFHIATRGRASRYDFLKRALEIAGFEAERVLVPTTDAKTAENLVLESLMLEMFGIDMPTWEEDLASYLQLQGIAK